MTNTYRKASIPVVACVALVFLFAGAEAPGYEERIRDITASVVISTTFNVTVDNPSMDFGYINPGESYTLYPERYYNEVTCVSNTGRPWFLKMSVVGDIKGGRGASIPKSNLTWTVDSIMGNGFKVDGWNPFDDKSVLVYSGSEADSAGEPVRVRLKYKLDVPANVSADNYRTVIVFSMSETP